MRYPINGRLVGRDEEKKVLERLYISGRAEFLAVYGRRRVGKTFLITEFFRDKGVFFEVTGSPNATTQEQLLNFHREFCALFKREAALDAPKNWAEAFHRLAAVCRELAGAKRVILFFDELPWLASRRSGFLSALDYFWNRHASRIDNLFLIVCGSAASWMVNKIVNNRGGLYGRLSGQIRLFPFTLHETELYLRECGIELPHRQICELYMAVGGVPKYLSYIPRGLSAAQTINQICFSAQAPLLTEFHKLYHSLFENPGRHIAIIEALAAARRGGLKRQELMEASPQLTSGGAMSAVLQELEESGFISVSLDFANKTKDHFYRLTDEYSLFYLRWIDAVKSELLQGSDADYWMKIQGTPAWYSWIGRAFESLCFKHVSSIKQALGIRGVTTHQGHWEFRPPRKGDLEGAEIDLVIDRADQCINLCEIKFSAGEYAVTRKDAEILERKKRVFREQTKTRKALFTTLITPYGVKEGAYLSGAIDNALTLEALFF